MGRGRDRRPRARRGELGIRPNAPWRIDGKVNPAYKLEYDALGLEVAMGRLGGARCAMCGEADPEVLEIDHRNEGDGKVDRAKYGGAKGVIWAICRGEIGPDRCQVLCANCHRRKTRAFLRSRKVLDTITDSVVY